MNAIFSQSRRTAGVVGLVGALLLVAGSGAGQASGESASDLVNFLTYQSDRPDKSAVTIGLLGCGHFQEDRAAAKKLVGLGAAASTELERALDSLEQSGEKSPFSLNAGWLLEAYARLNGSQAYPRLRRMMGKADLNFLHGAIDASAAVSLGLTSYVHASRRPARSYHCGRSEGPRDALDGLVLGWLNADYPRLEGSLGPEGASALKQLQENESWAAIRSGLPHGKPGAVVAVGYRFQGAGGWVQASRLIDEDVVSQDEIPPNVQSPEIYTLFTGASGKDCTGYTVRFVATGAYERGATKYTVNNSDLTGLLRLITSCAAKDE